MAHREYAAYGSAAAATMLFSAISGGQRSKVGAMITNAQAVGPKIAERSQTSARSQGHINDTARHLYSDLAGLVENPHDPMGLETAYITETNIPSRVVNPRPAMMA